MITIAMQVVKIIAGVKRLAALTLLALLVAVSPMPPDVKLVIRNQLVLLAIKTLGQILEAIFTIFQEIIFSADLNG